MDQLSFLPEERPAKVSPSPDSAREWMMTVATYPSNFVDLLNAYAPAGSFGKTFPGSCRWMEDGRLEPSSGRWLLSGMAAPGECLTLNTSKLNHTLAPSPSDGSVSSLSDILETGAHLLRYCLSAKACAGILHRAEKRGKVLPEVLRAALQRVADSKQTLSAGED